MRHYCFLKAKAGELKAIKHANKDNDLIPVLDVPTQRDIDPDKLFNQINKSHKHIRSNCQKEKLIYIDHFDIDLNIKLPNGDHPILMHELLINDGYKIGFVTGLDRDNIYDNTISHLSKKHGSHVAVRLLLDDILIPSITIKKIKSLIPKISNVKGTLIFIDCRVVDFVSLPKMSSVVIDFIKKLNTELIVNEIVLTSSSIPQSIGKLVETGETKTLDRLESSLWGHVHSACSEHSNLTYGDYATVSPEYVEMDFNGPPPMAPKITYTLGTGYIVARGKSVIHHPDGFKQFITLADSIVLDGRFRAPGHSFGEKYIFKIAQGVNGTGNATTWITACVNQHIEFIAGL